MIEDTWFTQAELKDEIINLQELPNGMFQVESHSHDPLIYWSSHMYLIGLKISA